MRRPTWHIKLYGSTAELRRREKRRREAWDADEQAGWMTAGDIISRMSIGSHYFPDRSASLRHDFYWRIRSLIEREK